LSEEIVNNGVSVNRKIVSIAMPPELHEEMKTASESENRSVTSLIREACQRLLVAPAFSEDPDGRYFR
jgi:hypothetical protein